MISPINSTGVYTKILSTLEEIRTIAKSKVDLPQICVIGDQSSGKSSLLSSIIGYPGLLPEGGTMVTKCPIIINLRPGAKLGITVGRNYPEVAEDAEGLEEPSEESSPTKTFTALSDGCKAIRKEQQHILKKENRKVSTTPVQVDFTAPSVPTLVIVDLPGIIHNGEGVHEVETVIKQYIKPDKTLIVVVRPADMDSETQKALSLAKELDPTACRTLEVFTKCDTLSTPENKKRMTQLLTESGQNFSDDLRPHGVCCRFKGKKGNDSEHTVFEELVPNLLGDGSVVGVKNLSTRLEFLLAERVKVNIPILEKDITIRNQDAQNTLDEIGEQPKNKEEFLSYLTRHLQEMEAPMRQSISKILEVFREEVHATKVELTQEWTDTQLTFDAFMNPFFQGNAAFERCAELIVTFWEPPLDKVLVGVEKCLKSELMSILEKTNLPKGLKTGYKEVWGDQANEMVRELKNETNKIIEAEKSFGTMNDYLDSNFKGDAFDWEPILELYEKGLKVSCEAKMKEIVLEDGREGVFINSGVGHLVNHFMTLLRQSIGQQSKMAAYGSLHGQTQVRLYNAVKAHWGVEHKTFIDCVFKRVNEIVIKGWSNWVNSARHNDKIRSNAIEERAILRKRALALKTKTQMEQCLSKVRELSGLV